MSPVACTKNAIFRACKPAVQRFQQSSKPACISFQLACSRYSLYYLVLLYQVYTSLLRTLADLHNVHGRFEGGSITSSVELKHCCCAATAIAGALSLLCSFCFRMAASGEWSKQLESAKADGMSFLKRPCVRNSLMSGIATGTLMGIHRVRVGREYKMTGMT